MDPIAEKYPARRLIFQRQRMLFNFGVLVILVLICLGCSMPFPELIDRGLATAIPTLTSIPPQPIIETIPATIPTKAVELPPALVEVSPLSQSVLTQNFTPVLYFNQAMDRGSVENSIETQPALLASFDWIDDATLRLVPSQPVSLDDDLALTIKAGARAANGKELGESILLNFQAPEPLRVIERLPKPDAVDVNPSSAIVVTFNRPVVSLGSEPGAAPPAFSLETDSQLPAVQGRGEWLNTSTYIYYPEPALYGGKQYTARVPAALTAVGGGGLAPDQDNLEWSFTTAAPSILALDPKTDHPIHLDDVFAITFNQAMDRTSVEQNFTLVRADGSQVGGAFSWDDALTQVTFTPSSLLDRDAAYSVVLFGSARSQGGAMLGTDFAATFSTVPQFAVTQTSPSTGELLNSYYGYSTVTLSFSSPVAMGQDLNRLIVVSPAIHDQTISRSFDGYQIFLNGYFQPSTSYTLAISPDIGDQWGAMLGVRFSFIFSTTAAQPALVIPALQAGGQTIYVPYGDTSLPAQSINIERLALARGSLSVPDYIQSQESFQGIQNWEPLVKARWVQLLYPTENETEAIEIPLSQANEPLEPGLYFLKVDTQPVIEGSANSSPVLLVVSPIHITLKTSLRQAFIWAVNITSQEPVAGVKVTIYDQSAQPVANCLTDASGICQADLPPQDQVDTAYYAVIGQPGDPQFSLAAPGWSQGVSPWDLNMVYQRESPDPLVYLYTDRPIYRPGQTVQLKAVVRREDNGRYAPPDLKEIHVDMVSPYDPVTGQSQVLANLTIPLNQLGTGTGAYILPGDAPVGVYTLQTQEVKFTEMYFTVAEYRKPEIDLQVGFVQENSLLGEDIDAVVNAKYFFGAPAGNVAVRWMLLSEPGYPDIPGNMLTGRVDTSWMEPWDSFGQGSVLISEGQDVTAVDGSLAIKIPGELVHDRLESAPDRMYNLTLEVILEDESGLPVSARDQMRLHPSPYYIGVQPEKWTATALEEITYQINTVDWKGERVGNLPLSAHFSRVTWVEQPRSDLYSPPEFRMEKIDAGSTDFNTSENGEARLAFIPAEPGTFMVEITGNDGAITQALIWVGGKGQAVWPGLPNQRLLLRSDAVAYHPGDTAKIFIPNPFAGSALALVTVERAKVMRSEVVQIQGASLEYNLGLSAEDAPNIYVSVTILGRTSGRPDFRVGYLEFSVDPVDYLLDLDLRLSPTKAQPGQDVTITMRARDRNGSPVQGEFSLALVDKAVLALADPNSPRIEEAFYGKQYLGVRSSYSLANYAGRSLYTPPGRGGGGEAGLETVPVRENFEDTAYWNGAIETDVTGAAQVTVMLPDNLTTWQADVRSLTADTLVGSASVEIVTSKPLLVRPVTPRFAVAGDHLELAAVVQNNTTDPLRVSVELEGAGFTLDDLNSAVQVVDLPAGERLRVGWWGTVEDVEALDLVFSAQAGSLQDATRPENGKLPVVRYVAPQTFGTSGVIAETGTRLELVSIPRSFSPMGGNLRLELSPSLIAVIVDGLQAQDEFPRDINEPVSSRLLANLALYNALGESQSINSSLIADLKQTVTSSADYLAAQQNEDGGWGWVKGSDSDPYLSSSILIGLVRAARSGVFVDEQILQRGRDYLAGIEGKQDLAVENWELDQWALRLYALQQAGREGLDFQRLLQLREKLSPWGKAFLALAIDGAAPGDSTALALIGDLTAGANRSATGASWQDANPRWYSWSTSNFTTAAAVYAIAQLDPTSTVLTDALRYLVLNRRPNGSWSSSYESAWALMALVEVARGSGDLQASYAYSAAINGTPLINGKIEGENSPAQPITGVVPLAQLRQNDPNALEIEHGEGNGQLYYRAYLNVSHPVRDTQPVARGIYLSRQYFQAGQDCRKEVCLPASTVSLADAQPLLVRLSLTIPQDMYYVVVEDQVPAGVEILNPNLKTTQQNYPVGDQPGEGENPQSLYSLDDPLSRGWGWWLFQNPKISGSHIRWVVDYLPAGTYELTYRVTPFLAGEFQLIPAHAYQNYFPDVEGFSAGAVLVIQ